MSDMPMSSPPRVSSTPSDFMACSGIVKPESKGYYSFPESGHFTTALSFVNSSLAEIYANTRKTVGFGPASYPGRCRSKDFEIHGSSLDGGVLSSYSGSTHSLLPRRFSYQESLPISFGGTHQFVYPFTPETGFFDFMGKIRDNSQSEFQFPGRTFSDRFGSSASSRREENQGMSVGQCSDSVFICPSSSIASAGGFLDFDHGRHSTRTSTHSSNPVVSVGVLAPNFSVVGGTCSHPSSVVTSSSMVASGKTSSEGSFVGSSRPQPNFVHRCESDGLGSLSGGQDSIRPLVRCSVGGTHQSSRDESCVSFSPSVSGCDSGSVTTGCHGQLHSSGLSSESRGTHSFSLYHLSKEILLLCHSLDIILSVRHVPGSQNLLADALSRSRVPVNTEWEIHPSVFQEIILRWDRPHIDLFATSLNHKLETYVSPIPDEKAWAVDAMTLSGMG
ncbi:unnamed protein product [Mytilus edulis]|uniref:Uncharacterized protein n=1 Tax=Mytilus edulis TaxID=6550 RepID=A0A8S3VFF0_MYTED|nr:unnamed protein product [Mytilus edulis]